MNFEHAKENMVKQQVLSGGVQLGALVDAILAIPREAFLPDIYKCLAYSDSNLKINGRTIRSPMLTAKILDALNIKSTDKVLKLGLESGYTAALLSVIAERVEVLDYCHKTLLNAKNAITSIGISNVSFDDMDKLVEIIESNNKYDCICISNEIDIDEFDVEESVLSLLNLGGRMTYTVRKPDFNKIYMVTKLKDSQFETKFLFDTYSK